MANAPYINTSLLLGGFMPPFFFQSGFALQWLPATIRQSLLKRR
jgi:hypothetical protein